MRITDVADRAAGYGIPGVIVDGMDAIAVHQTALAAVEQARAGGGPTLIEAKTYRFYDHQGIKGLRIPYRSEDEVASWKARDPIALLEQRAVQEELMNPAECTAIWDEIRAEVADAIAFAESSPDPDPADLLQDVYTV
jgi:TPP-dependent pyruvate/acetoin dehydrogenase alpha subunit